MDDLSSMANALKDGIENNATDAPHLSVDPESDRVSVVGNPNEINTTKGEYNVTFAYPADKVSEEDKLKMRLNQDTGYYEVDVKYVDKRIKPIYRAKILFTLIDILTNMDLMDESGYNSNVTEYAIGKALIDQTDNIATLARMILGIPDEQIQYLMPKALINFFVQIFQNEPNIIGESNNFLSSSKEQAALKKTLTQSIQRN